MAEKTKKIGFLSLGQTHDDFQDLIAALNKKGVECCLINLKEKPRVEFEEFSVISVRDCRGYHLETDFLSKINKVASQLTSTILVNSIGIITASFDKSDYLRKLETAGAEIVPTIWLDSQSTIKEIFQITGWKELVLKPVISSKSWNTYRIRREGGNFGIFKASPQTISPVIAGELEAEKLLCETFKSGQLCAQQFIPGIINEGEISFVFIEGKFRYAIQKTVAGDNWIAHEFFGGENRMYQAGQKEIKWAEHIYDLLEQTYGNFLYARIDGIFHKNNLLLLECELMVARLFLKEANFIDEYAQALIRALR